jgi:hypothetical protein
MVASVTTRIDQKGLFFGVHAKIQKKRKSDQHLKFLFYLFQPLSPLHIQYMIGRRICLGFLRSWTMDQLKCILQTNRRVEGGRHEALVHEDATI